MTASYRSQTHHFIKHWPKSTWVFVESLQEIYQSMTFGKFVLQIHAKFSLSTIKYVVFHVTRWFGKLVLTYPISSLLASLPSQKLSGRYRNRDIHCQFLHYLFFCKFNWQFFCLDFLSRRFTIHRTAGEGGGYSCNFMLPLPPSSQAPRH